MNKLFLLFILMLNFAGIKAQDKFSIYLDIGGASPIASINLDKRVKKLSSVGLGYRLGVGMVLLDVEEYPRHYVKLKPSFPIGINYVFGKDKKLSNLEIAVQTTYVPVMSVFEVWDLNGQYLKPINNVLIPSFFIGCRMRPLNKKGLIRLGYNPIYFNNSWQSWFTLSLGWTAKKKI